MGRLEERATYWSFKASNQLMLCPNRMGETIAPSDTELRVPSACDTEAVVSAGRPVFDGVAEVVDVADTDIEEV